MKIRRTTNKYGDKCIIIDDAPKTLTGFLHSMERRKMEHRKHIQETQPSFVIERELTQAEEKEAFLYTSRVNASKMFAKYL